jgi:hypothetical protein
MLETILSWRSLVGAVVPPRDPNDDEDEEDEEAAATRTTTASRPLSESQTKISPASEAHSKLRRQPLRKTSAAIAANKPRGAGLRRPRT